MRKSDRRRGVTLIEVMISSFILTAIVLVLYLILHVQTTAYAQGSLHAELNAQAVHLLDRLARELRDSSPTTFAPSFPNASPSLTFAMNAGFQGGQITYGAPVTYAFAYEPGETDNGKDDNRDGRVDEGRIVRSEGGRSVVLTRDAKEGGLAFTQVYGNAVTATLVLERLDDRRKPITYTRQVTIRMRN